MPNGPHYDVAAELAAFEADWLTGVAAPEPDYSSAAQIPWQNPLHERVKALGALTGIHVLQLSEEFGGERLTIADAGIAGAPPTLKQSVLEDGLRSHHFFFDSGEDADGQAFGAYGDQVEGNDDAGILYYPGMLPHVAPSDSGWLGLVLHLGRRHQDHILPRATHLDIAADEEAAAHFMASTEIFLTRAVKARHQSRTLNLHVH